MRGKTLAILLITLAVVAAAGILLIRSKPSGPRDGRIGEPLFQDLRVNDVTAVQIKSAKRSASLAKREDGWVVQERFDYPADFSKLAQMVRQLKELKVGTRFEGSEETLGRLGLKDTDNPSADEEDALRLLLKNKDGSVLADLRLGKPRMSGGERQIPDGQYIRIGEDPTVFLVDRTFNAYSADPASWLDKKLSEVQASEVRKISCTDGKMNLLYAFERSESGKDLAPLVEIPKGRELDRGSVNRVAGGLSSLRLQDVKQAGQEIDQKDLYVLEYQLFNGMIYRLYPEAACQDDLGCPVRIKVDYQPPSQPPEAKAETTPTPDEASPPPEPSPVEMASRAESLDSRFTPWVFYVPKWQHDNLLTSLEQLLKKPEEKTDNQK